MLTPEDGASTNLATRACCLKFEIRRLMFRFKLGVANIMNHLTSNLTLQTSNYLYTHIKISQRIIQTCFQICAWLTLTNDQCTTNTKLTGRKFFSIADGYHK